MNSGKGGVGKESGGVKGEWMSIKRGGGGKGREPV